MTLTQEIRTAKEGIRKVMELIAKLEEDVLHNKADRNNISSRLHGIYALLKAIEDKVL
ncbi:MAG: hypothetical protein QXG00_01175 [Candidatus Woesearchaeota archaeon]